MLATTRVRTLAALLLAVASLSGWGCDMFSPKSTSPISGQKLTQAQLDAEEAAAVRKVEAESRAEALKAQAELARIQREAEFQIMRAQTATDAQLAEIAYTAENKMEGVRVDLTTATEALTATIEGLRGSYAAARADIEAKATVVSDVAGFASSLLGSPVVQGAAASNPLILAAVGLGSAWLGRWTKAKAADADATTKVAAAKDADQQNTLKQLAELRAQLMAEAKAREDAAWDEAKREAAESQRATDAAWDAASNEAERRSLLALAGKTTVNAA